jgi:hypothetical protein
VAFPLEFAVNPDAEEPSLLDRRYNLLIEVNWRRRSGAGASKVDEFTLFGSKLHSPRMGPLAARLPSGFEVSAGRLCILTERKEVKVVGKADCNKAGVVLELGIEACSIEEEENGRERRPLRYSGGNTVRKRRLAVKVETSRAVVEEAANPPNYPGGEPLVLEGVEEAGVVYYIEGSLNIQL